MAPSASRQAEALARYLIGGVLRRGPLPAAARAAVRRYLQAEPVALPPSPSRGDRAVAGFAGRHPWSLPFLDAAAGILRRHGLLRCRLLLMSAVLEASPAFADEFLPSTSSRPVLARRLAALALAAAAKTAVGLLLYPLAWLHRP